LQIQIDENAVSTIWVAETSATDNQFYQSDK